MAIDRINATALLDGGVTTADIADDAVTTAKINAGAVDTTELASGAVTSAKLDTNISVTGDFTADSTNDTLFVDASTNRVHIGGGTSDTNTSALSVRKNGGGNFIANFENTSTTAPYGVMVRDPSGSSAGYPLLQVVSSGGNHYFRVDSNTGKNYFAPGGTEKVRIDSDGMKFNGDTAAANALDDYEEGSWTPSIGADATYTNQQGIYTKIGRYVSAAFDITINARNSGSQTQMLGLPFTVNNGVTPVLGVHSGHCSYYSSLAQNVYSLDMYAINGSGTVYFTGHTIASGNIGNSLPVFGNSTRIVGTVHYYAN